VQIEAVLFMRHVWGGLWPTSGFQGDVQLVLIPLPFLDNAYSVQITGFALMVFSFILFIFSLSYLIFTPKLQVFKAILHLFFIQI
jgi:hypothetical protein